MDNTQLSLPYKEITSVMGRKYYRENFAISSKESYKIPIDQIQVRDGYNKRRVYKDMESVIEWVKNNTTDGIVELDPLPVIETTDEGEIFILRGHRRLRGIHMAIAEGLKVDFVVCTPAQKDINELDRVIDIYASNMHQSKLEPLEQADVCFDLKNNFGEISNEEIGKRLGISRQQVDNLLILASADDATKQEILNGNMGITEALKYIRNSKKVQKDADKAEVNANKNPSAAPQEPKDELAGEMKELEELDRKALDIRTSDYNPDEVEDGKPLDLVGNTVAYQKEENQSDEGIKKYDESRDEIKQIQNCIKLADKLEAITNKFDVPDGSKKDVADIVKWMQKDLAEVREWIHKNKKQNKAR